MVCATDSDLRYILMISQEISGSFGTRQPGPTAWTAATTTCSGLARHTCHHISHLCSSPSAWHFELVGLSQIRFGGFGPLLRVTPAITLIRVIAEGSLYDKGGFICIGQAAVKGTPSTSKCTRSSP